MRLPVSDLVSAIDVEEYPAVARNPFPDRSFTSSRPASRQLMRTGSAMPAREMVRKPTRFTPSSFSV